MKNQTQDFAGASEGVSKLTKMIADQIRAVAELHEAGILTDEEFTAKKTELLARL